ncbi:hypothetical protein C8Q73DRAFT_409678 [Cubamyces lactineus]|nr:hypothetical protein C8Q73DRAFT_409678 [Cubamyces lactineus]
MRRTHRICAATTQYVFIQLRAQTSSLPAPIVRKVLPMQPRAPIFNTGPGRNPALRLWRLFPCTVHPFAWWRCSCRTGWPAYSDCITPEHTMSSSRCAPASSSLPPDIRWRHGRALPPSNIELYRCALASPSLAPARSLEYQVTLARNALSIAPCFCAIFLLFPYQGNSGAQYIHRPEDITPPCSKKTISLPRRLYATCSTGPDPTLRACRPTTSREAPVCLRSAIIVSTLSTTRRGGRAHGLLLL